MTTRKKGPASINSLSIILVFNGFLILYFLFVHLDIHNPSMQSRSLLLILYFGERQTILFVNVKGVNLGGSLLFALAFMSYSQDDFVQQWKAASGRCVENKILFIYNFTNCS